MDYELKVSHLWPFYSNVLLILGYACMAPRAIAAK